MPSAAKVIYILNFEENRSLLIGRGEEADFHLGDYSISRRHAFIIRGSNQEYYLVDNHSKFGTQVRLDYPLEVQQNQPKV